MTKQKTPEEQTEDLTARCAVIFSDLDTEAICVLVKVRGESFIRSAFKGEPPEIAAMLARALERWSMRARSARN